LIQNFENKYIFSILIRNNKNDLTSVLSACTVGGTECSTVDANSECNEGALKCVCKFGYTMGGTSKKYETQTEKGEPLTKPNAKNYV